MCRVTAYTIRDWVRSGKLPAVKLGRKVIRIDPRDVQHKLDHDQRREESVSSRRSCQRAVATNGGATPQPSAPPVVVQSDSPSISKNGRSSTTTTNGTGINLALAAPAGPCRPTGVLRKVMGVMMRFFSPGTNADPLSDVLQTTTVSISKSDPRLTLAAVERAHIRRVLEQHHSNIDHSAHVLGISATTLRNKIVAMVREGITQAAKEA
jgi:transcriptional regulator with GAF, ATPase, and Fis domain